MPSWQHTASCSSQCIWRSPRRTRSSIHRSCHSANSEHHQGQNNLWAALEILSAFSKCHVCDLHELWGGQVALLKCLHSTGEGHAFHNWLHGLCVSLCRPVHDRLHRFDVKDDISKCSSWLAALLAQAVHERHAMTTAESFIVVL